MLFWFLHIYFFMSSSFSSFSSNNYLLFDFSFISVTGKQVLIVKVWVYNNITVCDLDTMPGNTTSVCLNSNRWWIKSALGSSAPKSLNSSKTLSTCSWIMTGGQQRVHLSECNLLLHSFEIVCIFWCLLCMYVCIYHYHISFFICFSLSGSRFLQTMNHISVVKKKLMNSTRWVKMVWMVYQYGFFKGYFVIWTF